MKLSMLLAGVVAAVISLPAAAGDVSLSKALGVGGSTAADHGWSVVPSRRAAARSIPGVR